MNVFCKSGLAMLGLICTATPSLAAEKEVVLDRLEVRLFYKETGRLSDDILSKAKPFIAFNTIIGEGDAEESADDVLVIAVLSSGKWEANNQVFAEIPLEITATNSDGEILGTRRFATVLTSGNGLESNALWLQDVTCAGDVNIEAKFNGKIERANVSFNCGE